MLTTILLDLDGTLLPMDLDRFLSLYYRTVSRAFAGFMDPEAFRGALVRSVLSVLRNTSDETNETLFWRVFPEETGIPREQAEPIFLDYYGSGFEEVRASCGQHSLVPETLRILKQKGYRLVLATNPLFARIAVERRLSWAGLEPSQFDHMTTLENSTRCKPSSGYYREILRSVGAVPEECLMLGNDNLEDLAAADAGVASGLVTDNLLDQTGRGVADASLHGTLADLHVLASSLPEVPAAMTGHAACRPM